MRKEHIIIIADLASDLGSRFVGLILVDLLIFKCDDHLINLLLMGMIQQAPPLLFSPIAGVWIDKLGARFCLIIVNICKCGLIAVFLFTSSSVTAFSFYFLFITVSLFFNIGHLSLMSLLIPKTQLISFRALNERVTICGNVLAPLLICQIIVYGGRAVSLGMAALLILLSTCSIYWLPRCKRAPKNHDESQRRGGVANKFFLRYKAIFEQNSHLKGFFIIIGLMILSGGALNFGLPIFFKTRFMGEISQWGFIISSYQAGSLLGALLLSHVSKSSHLPSVCNFALISLSMAMFILPFAKNFIQITILMAVLGAGFIFLQLFLEARIQQQGQTDQAGKVISSLVAFKALCFSFSLLFGALVTVVWKAEMLLIAGSLITGAALFLIGKIQFND